MSTEVRTGDGELVGWIDGVPDDHKIFRMQDEPEINWAKRDPLADLEQTPKIVEIHRHAMAGEPWCVTSDQLAKLRRASIFRPLITKTMALRMARAAALGTAEWAASAPPDLSNQEAHEDLLEISSRAVESVLAAESEPT